MTQKLCRARRDAGISMTEVIMVVAIVMALVLASLYLFNPAEPDTGEDYVPPWRQTNAVYAYNALEEFRGHMQAYYDMFGVLPGDRPEAGYTNSTGAPIGNSDGHIQRGNEENLKVFRDLHVAGITPNDTVLVRGRPLDIYWLQVRGEQGVIDEGHYLRLDGFNRLEAQAMDRRYDDGGEASGDILCFPYEEDNDFATLLVKFSLFK